MYITVILTAIIIIILLLFEFLHMYIVLHVTVSNCHLLVF